ncbi:MAG: DMT family transporter, partial [Candidatus Aminicenantales bacterium]
MATMRNSERWGRTDVFMLLAVVFWAVNFAFIKIALREFRPLAFNGLRMTFASLVMMGILILTGKGLRVPRRDFWKVFLLGIVGNTLYQMFFIHGLNMTTASNTSIIMAMTPASVAFLSSVLKHETLHWAAWLGIFLSFVGFWMVITGEPGAFLFSWERLRGDVLIFLGNIVWAVYTVFSKPVLTRVSPLKWASLTMAAGTLFFSPFCVPALVEQDFHQVTARGWGILVYSGFFALAVSYVIWYASVQRVGNSRTAIYGNVTPVFTVGFAAVVLSERLSPWQAIGALIIFAGVYLTRSGYRLFQRKTRGADSSISTRKPYGAG